MADAPSIVRVFHCRFARGLILIIIRVTFRIYCCKQFAVLLIAHLGDFGEYCSLALFSICTGSVLFNIHGRRFIYSLLVSNASHL